MYVIPAAVPHGVYVLSAYVALYCATYSNVEEWL